VGARELIRNKKARILSVKFSLIGAGMLGRLKKLEWIVNRRANTNNINKDACVDANVGISMIYPGANAEVSKYIYNHFIRIPDHKKARVVIWGAGKIAKRFVDMIGEGKMGVTFVNSKTPKRLYGTIMSIADVLIISCSYNESTKELFDYDLLKHLPNGAEIICITSGGSVFKNRDLLRALREGIIKHITIDVLSVHWRKELLKTGKVNYTEHTAWKTALEQEEYVQLVKDEIDAILNGKPKNIILKRCKPLSF